MKMIRETSLIAFMENEIEGKNVSQEKRISAYLSFFLNGLTRNEISRELNLSINAVCGRINSLIKKKKAFENGTRIDKFSNKKNYIICLVEK